jgi:hypothetical protein
LDLLGGRVLICNSGTVGEIAVFSNAGIFGAYYSRFSIKDSPIVIYMIYGLAIPERVPEFNIEKYGHEEK